MTDRGSAAILSADGKTLVFSARQHNLTRLFIRTLDELQATPLAGTEEGTYQFFSPKGQWIAFFVGNRLKNVAVAGGAGHRVRSHLGSRWNVARGRHDHLQSFGRRERPAHASVEGAERRRRPAVRRYGSAN